MMSKNQSPKIEFPVDEGSQIELPIDEGSQTELPQIFQTMELLLNGFQLSIVQEQISDVEDRTTPQPQGIFTTLLEHISIINSSRANL